MATSRLQRDLMDFDAVSRMMSLSSAVSVGDPASGSDSRPRTGEPPIPQVRKIVSDPVDTSVDDHFRYSKPNRDHERGDDRTMRHRRVRKA